MLDETEWAQLAPWLNNVPEQIKAYRQRHGVSLAEAQRKGLAPALAEYFRLTGFPETNGNVLFHHRLALFGPPCRRCGKLLRSPRAKHCAACGAATFLDQHTRLSG